MSVVREMMAAGPGCALANGMLNGLELTKVKLQLQDQHKPAYRSSCMGGVMKQIVQEEGIVKGLLTPGLSASIVRSMIYGGYRVGLYSTIRDNLLGLVSLSATKTTTNGDPTKNVSSLQDHCSTVVTVRIASGMITGGVGAMLTCPLDVVRTRMQADAGRVLNGVYATGLRKGHAVRYTTIWATFVSIVRTEGWSRGVYRGATVTVTRASLLNGAQLASYDSLKRVSGLEEGPILHCICALMSGGIAQTVAMPIDTIKSSMMVGNHWEDVWRVVRTNGPLWLYRGYLPACTGQGMIMVLQMPLIEQFRKLLGVQAI
jgi:hypothetical protein